MVDVASTSKVTVVSKDLSRKGPLLLTELVVAPDGGGFAYSTPVETIHSRITAVFDRAISKLQVSAPVLPNARQYRLSVNPLFNTCGHC